MKLSFVIPAHNEEAYIGDCLASVIREVGSRQNEVEIIVVNNVSTDRTGEVAAAFPQVKVVDEPHKGIVWARRAGYLASSGDLIANIDADTTLPAGWLDEVLNEFSADSKLIALSGPHVYQDLSLGMRFLVSFFYYLAYFFYILSRFVFHIGSMLQGGNFIIKREAIEKIHGFDTTIEFYGEDTDLARRLYKIGKVKFTFRLKIYASSRRLTKEGVFNAGIRYGVNYFWVMLFKKPYSQKHLDIRQSNGSSPEKKKEKVLDSP